MIIEALNEFQLPSWVCAIDFKKAFDSVEHDHLWEALYQHKVPNKYTAKLAQLYRGQTAKIITDKESKELKIGRGTKQGDPLSPKLFNAVLEKAFTRAKEHWKSQGWGISVASDMEERLTNLRFADDVLLIAESEQQLQAMIADLIDETGKVGLEIHIGKTKVLTSENQGGEEEMEEARHLEVRGNKIEILKKDGLTMYLGRLLSLQNPHDVELDNRIKKGWKKFMSLKNELCGKAYPSWAIKRPSEIIQRHGNTDCTIRLRSVDNGRQQREVIKKGTKKDVEVDHWNGEEVQEG